MTQKKAKRLGTNLIVGIVALLLAAIFVVVWAIGSNGFKENNPVKWSWWNGNAGNNGDELDKDNEIVPAGEGLLMLTPRTTLNSPVALSTERVADNKKSVTITATIEPENGFYKSVAWRASSNALSVTQDKENPLKATVTLVGTLSEEATITCLVYSVKTVTATCMVKYLAFPDVRELYVDMSTNGVFHCDEDYQHFVSVSADIAVDMTDVELVPKFYNVWLNPEFVYAVCDELGIERTSWDYSYDGWLSQTDDGRYYFNGMASPTEICDVSIENAGVSELDFLKAFFKCSHEVRGDSLKAIEIGYLSVATSYIYDGVEYTTYSPQIDISFDDSYAIGVLNVTIENGNIVFTD